MPRRLVPFAFMVLASTASVAACRTDLTATTELRDGGSAADAEDDPRPPVIVSTRVDAATSHDAGSTPSRLGADADVEPAPDATDEDDGLVARWGFDQPIANDVVHDDLGRGLDGVVHESVSRVEGRIGKALRFDGGWVQVDDVAPLDAIREGLTIAAWVRRDRTGFAQEAILSRQAGSGSSEHYYLLLYDDKPLLLLDTFADGLAISAPSSVPAGVWTHLAATYDGSTARLYVNGVEVARDAKSVPLTRARTPLVLGGNVNDGSGRPSELLHGALDDVRLYRRALAPAEIAALARP